MGYPNRSQSARISSGTEDFRAANGCGPESSRAASEPIHAIQQIEAVVPPIPRLAANPMGPQASLRGSVGAATRSLPITLVTEILAFSPLPR